MLEKIMKAVSELTDEDLVKLSSHLEAIKRKRAQAILDRAQTMAAMLSGGSLHIRKKRSPSMPKYRDPETGQTWSGQGRSPLWFNECLSRGIAESDLLIKKS